MKIEPIYSEQAQKAVLGCILTDPLQTIPIVSFLKTSDFFGRPHQIVFECFMDMYHSKRDIDILTVSSELKNRGLLEKVGGEGTISDLHLSMFNLRNVESYANEIRNKSMLSQLCVSSELNVYNALHRQEEPDLVLLEAEQGLEKIRKNCIYDETLLTMKTACNRLVDSIINHKEVLRDKIVYTGFNKLDNLTKGFLPGEYIIIGASPGVGKTAFAINLATNIAKSNQKVGFISIEMNEEEIIKRFACHFSKVNNSKMRNVTELGTEDLTEVCNSIEVVNNLPIMFDVDASYSTDKLRNRCYQLVNKHECKVIFIDYITLIKCNRSGLKKHEEIEEVSATIRELAKALKVPFFVLTQLTGDGEKSEAINLYDIAGSRQVGRDTHCAMFLNKKENKIQLTIKKGRDVPSGVHQDFNYKGSTYTFTEL